MDINDAFLLKIAWGLLSNGPDLWVSVLKEKYRWKEGDLQQNLYVKNGSLLWRSITRIWSKWQGDPILEGWVELNDTLGELAVTNIPESEKNFKVVDYWLEDGTGIGAGLENTFRVPIIFTLPL